MGRISHGHPVYKEGIEDIEERTHVLLMLLSS